MPACVGQGPQAQHPGPSWGVHAQGEKVGKGRWMHCVLCVVGETRSKHCIPSRERIWRSWTGLGKGCGKIGEGSGTWETAFKQDAEAGPCLFSLWQARLGCESIAGSMHLPGEGISFSQKCVMKPGGQGLEQVSHRGRNLLWPERALHPPPCMAEGLPITSLQSRSLSLGVAVPSRTSQHQTPCAWGEGCCA